MEIRKEEEEGIKVRGHSNPTTMLKSFPAMFLI